MNPYSPPVAQGPYPAQPPGSYAAPGAVSELVVDLLRQTRPWVLFLGVLSFLGSGLMFLVSLGAMVAGLAASASSRSEFPTAALGLIYLPLAGLYIYPGIKLVKYAGAIGRLLQSRSTVDLEDALLQQKSLWKFSGIAAIVVIVLYFVAIIGVVAVGLSAAKLFT